MIESAALDLRLASDHHDAAVQTGSTVDWITVRIFRSNQPGQPKRSVAVARFHHLGDGETAGMRVQW